MAELTIPTWNLTDRLMKSRTRAGLSQTDMGDLLARNRATISSWEMGHTEPSLKALRRWAEITGVPLDWLLVGDEVRTGSFWTPGISLDEVDLRRSISALVDVSEGQVAA